MYTLHVRVCWRLTLRAFETHILRPTGKTPAQTITACTVVGPSNQKGGADLLDTDQGEG